ncbi:hypothetical protein LJC19_04665 [Oxalobacter sp. OttesenSCG-928-P03]|nr:hypothetical protein [Oxalobacter sp. OttesenSCG-928-P03]
MMLYAKFAWFFLRDTLIMLTGLAMAPIVATDVDETWNIIDPAVKETCQTPDSLMNGDGGDKVFFKKQMTWYLSFTDFGQRKWRECFARWWIATRWQWRNTTHGYSTYVLGLDETDLTIVETPKGRGYRKTATKDGEVVGFESKIDLKYPCLEKRFVIRMGWKFGWDRRFPAQFVFSIRPWQSM